MEGGEDSGTEVVCMKKKCAQNEYLPPSVHFCVEEKGTWCRPSLWAMRCSECGTQFTALHKVKTKQLAKSLKIWNSVNIIGARHFHLSEATTASVCCKYAISISVSIYIYDVKFIVKGSRMTVCWQIIGNNMQLVKTDVQCPLSVLTQRVWVIITQNIKYLIVLH